jgi:hypothetical protein
MTGALIGKCEECGQIRAFDDNSVRLHWLTTHHDSDEEQE